MTPNDPVSRNVGEAERLLRILAELTAGGTTEPTLIRLCEAGASVAAMSGAAIMLMSGGVQRGSVCATDLMSALIEELQFTVRQGPGVDAYRQRRPVVEPDLVDPATSRWPAFAPSAVAAGARATFAFPLHAGDARLGALDVYRNRPGDLSAHQHADLGGCPGLRGT